MKKTIVYILVAAILTASLCACGSSGTLDDPGYNSTDRPGAVPSSVPDMTPDVNDGIVNDRDGMIDSGDNGTTARGGSGTAYSNGTANQNSTANQNGTAANGSGTTTSGNSMKPSPTAKP